MLGTETPFLGSEQCRKICRAQKHVSKNDTFIAHVGYQDKTMNIILSYPSLASSY